MEPPSLYARRPARRSSPGFTLVEVLVVIAIISMLIAILLPVLANVRDQAVHTRCLSNLRQIGMAFLNYEADHGRFPGHPYEAGDTMAFPASIRGPRFDTRVILKPYVNPDFFVCPGVRSWKPTESTATLINVDYVITPGYYADATLSDPSDAHSAVFAPKFWTKSAKPWYFGKRAMNVIAGDKIYLDPVSSPGTWRHVVNHPGLGNGYGEWAPPGFAGTAWLQQHPAGTDRRNLLRGNFVFADGSARAVGPRAAGDMIPIPVRNPTRLGSDYLMPVRP